MPLSKTVFGTCLILVMLSCTIWITWNNNPINQTFVMEEMIYEDARNVSNSGTNNYKEMTDFYRVPHLNVYINKQPAMHVNTESMYIISVGFAKRSNYKQKLICLQQFKNGKILKSDVNIWELPTTSQVRAFKYHSVFIHCKGLSNKDMPVKISILPSDKLEADRYWLDVIDRRNHTVPAKDGVAMCLNSILRLHQPVKNPISDNSNILWNSPSLGINSRYRLP